MLKDNSRPLRFLIEHRAASKRDTISSSQPYQWGFFILPWDCCCKFPRFIHCLDGWLGGWVVALLVGFPCEKPKEPLKELDLGEFWALFSIPHCWGHHSLAVPHSGKELEEAGTWSPSISQSGWNEQTRDCSPRGWIWGTGAGRSTQACQDIKVEEIQAAVWKISNFLGCPWILLCCH